jgi:hypothetical protein
MGRLFYLVAALLRCVSVVRNCQQKQPQSRREQGGCRSQSTFGARLLRGGDKTSRVRFDAKLATQRGPLARGKLSFANESLQIGCR